MIEWLNTVLQGVMLGGLYALFAMGLSLMFGVMRLTNVAHGDFIILMAFAAYAAIASLGMTLSLLLLLPLAFAIGYGLQRGVLNGTLGNDPLPSRMHTPCAATPGPRASWPRRGSRSTCRQRPWSARPRSNDRRPNRDRWPSAPSDQRDW